MREEHNFGSKYVEPWKQLQDVDVHIYLSNQSLCVCIIAVSKLLRPKKQLFVNSFAINLRYRT